MVMYDVNVEALEDELDNIIKKFSSVIEIVKNNQKIYLTQEIINKIDKINELSVEV